jgi:hypothetical protein
VLLQTLAATNFLLGSYDAWLTQKRMKAFGKQFELNSLIKLLSTLLGSDLAAVIGVLGPCVGWTIILTFFNLPWALALLVGFNAKRFEIQLQSRAYEKAALQIQRMMKEFRESDATLPSVESTTQDSRSNFKEPNGYN